jgi:hypothetical protein
MATAEITFTHAEDRHALMYCSVCGPVAVVTLGQIAVGDTDITASYEASLHLDLHHQGVSA